MTGISNNPARIALLTAMEDAQDDGAKIWEEQPAARNSTKNALLQGGYVKVTRGKAHITEEGRAALKAYLERAIGPERLPETSQIALEAAPKADEAKAKFEAARAEVVKAPKAKAEKPKRAAAAAKKPEAKTEPAAEAPKGEWEQVREQLAAVPSKAEQLAAKAEQPVAAPQEEVAPLHRLVRILHTEYDVTAMEAPTYAIIWSAEILADKTDIETAKAALAALNRKRKQAGKVQAIPAEDHFLA